ncbi:MAG: patatin-like phospholipase family protein [Micavibrio sp.]
MSKKQEEELQKYYILHVPGGGLWGVLPIVTLKFLETMTRLPLCKQFNMTAGSSTGSIPLTALNVPKSINSTEPRYSADDLLDFYQSMGPRIFPQRSNYYVRQMVMDITKLAHDFFTALSILTAARLDMLVNFCINKPKHYIHDLMGRKKTFEPVNTSLFRNLHKWIYTPVNNRIKRGIDHLIEQSRYDISVLARILDATLRYEDSDDRVKFGNTLISHHVTAHNLTRDEPAIFFHFKDPESSKTQFLSDEDIDLDSIVLGSCAAQTIFKSPTLRNGETYVDIADFDTMRTPISSLDRHADKKLDVKLITIGTGQTYKQIDVESMNSMLFLQQMINDLGGYLFGIRKRYINKMADMDLQYRLGAKNIIKIDIAAVQESLKPDYLNDPRVPELAKFLGINLDDLTSAELPSSDLFNSRPENMKRLETLGWIMALKNLDTLMPLCRELVENSVAMGHIDQKQAQERIRLIDHFNAAAKGNPEGYVPEQVIGPVRKHHWFTFEEIRERTVTEKIKFLFRRAVGLPTDPVQPKPPVPDPNAPPPPPPPTIK